MAPWTRKIFPTTDGPTKYCPPRHFGGEEVVWRNVMQWRDAANRAGKGCNDRRRTNGDDDGFGERNVNSLDEVDGSKLEGEGKRGAPTTR